MPQLSADIRAHASRIARMATGPSKAAAWFDTLNDMLTTTAAEMRAGGVTAEQLKPLTETQQRFLEVRSEIIGGKPLPTAVPSAAPAFASPAAPPPPARPDRPPG